jgi:hypothetical protein
MARDWIARCAMTIQGVFSMLFRANALTLHACNKHSQDASASRH